MMFFSFAGKEKNQKKPRRCSSLPSFHSAVTTCSVISDYRQSFFQVPATAFASLARELMRPPLRKLSTENLNDNQPSPFSERSIDSISEVRMKENWGVLPIPKSACRLKPRFLTFCESVAP